MNNLPSPITWIDLARRFAILEPSDPTRPSNVLSVRADWEGVVIYCRDPAPSEKEIRQWLENLFPNRISRGQLEFKLDGPRHAQTLPVTISVDEDASDPRPSLGIIDGAVDFATTMPVREPLPVPIVAVQSVKGGTGRTSTAVALAARWASRVSEPIMIVDADLEAPGISYLFREAQREPRISLEDVIALAHAEPTEGAPETIAFTSEKLKDHRVGDLIVLPLRRSLDELASSAIRPEHLVTPKRPFALADLLAAIASKVGCAGVVVDVRAGLVPLGVNLGLDPEVAPVLVTTLSDQALQATGALVKFFTREIRRNGSRPRAPLLVVNRVPTLIQSTGLDQKLIDPLVTSIVETLLEGRTADVGADEPLFEDALDLNPIAVVTVGELPDLQIASRGWNEFIAQLATSGFSKRLENTGDTWLATEVAAEAPPTTISVDRSKLSNAERRTKLSTHADSLIAAENIQGAIPKPLVTQSLAALAENFRSEVPIAVSEGAKGTGKTLNARYLVSQKSWDKAVQELSPGSKAVPALIVPVCGSIQVSGSLLAQFDDQRRYVAKTLGFGDPQPIYQTTKWLGEQRASKSKRPWSARWLDAISWSCGYEVGKPDVGADFIQRLRAENRRVVAVFEGLEELYLKATSSGVAEMMRALLVDVPQRLRTEQGRPLGCIAYVRRDTVEASLPQNLSQYRREYSPYALSWTNDDVLELAAWLAQQSGAIPGIWDQSFRLKTPSDKQAALEPLWGRKLGTDDSPGKRTKEAYTATWIIAVLSDLHGRLIPRDLVQLLANAGKRIVSPDEDRVYSSRLLPPQSLRAAVDPTSAAKVQATEEEIAELKPIFAKFRNQEEAVVAPLSADALGKLGLQTDEIDVLKRHGIILGDAPPYEVQELFRRGLGLRHSGARHSVVNLYRRAQQRPKSQS